MYRRKGLQARSSRKSLVQSLQTVLQDKSQEMVRRSNNVQLLTEAFGRKVGMEDKALHELTLLAAIHDIGNVAIAEAVISKPGPLTEEEWETMRRHPEIGLSDRVGLLGPRAVAEGFCIIMNVGWNWLSPWFERDGDPVCRHVSWPSRLLLRD